MTTLPDGSVRGVRGTLVYLRPLEPDDAPLVHRWFEDTRIASLMGDLPRSLARRRQCYEADIADQDAEFFPFLICRLEDDLPVGRTDLFQIDRRHGSAALGITIGDPAMWDRGYGTDAVDALVDFAFGQLRLERVWPHRVSSSRSPCCTIESRCWLGRSRLETTTSPSHLRGEKA